MKIKYTTFKRENEILRIRKENFKLDPQDIYAIVHHNLKMTIKRYVNADTIPEKYYPIKDAVSFYDMLGHTYCTLADEMYLLENDVDSFAGILYLYILAKSKSYEYEASGTKITNNSIEYNRSKKRGLEQISFSAVTIDKFELFEKFADGIGCELIKAMYHKDYDKARRLAEQLPDTAEMYEKNKYYMSYYYESYFMKDLFLSILDKNEKAFNEALMTRIKNVRRGYIMPVDVVSTAMIKFASENGISYNFDVIEIPRKLIHGGIIIDTDKYKFPDFSEYKGEFI